MIIHAIVTYMLIQWICSLIIGYAVKTDSFAKKQIVQMRRISYFCVLAILTLFILEYYHFFQASIWFYLLLPVAGSVIIFFIGYSMLTNMYIINSTHDIKFARKKILKFISLLILPFGLFLLRVKGEYALKK
jgi:hypothetical protein